MLNYEKLYKYHLRKAKEYKEKLKDRDKAEWQEFTIFNEPPYYCGIDNERCTKCISTSEYFDNYGCMYIKNFKNY